MIEGFFGGVKIFDFGIFLGTEIWDSLKDHNINMGFFGVNFWSRDFFGFCWKS